MCRYVHYHYPLLRANHGSGQHLHVVTLGTPPLHEPALLPAPKQPGQCRQSRHHYHHGQQRSTKVGHSGAHRHGR